MIQAIRLFAIQIVNSWAETGRINYAHQEIRSRILMARHIFRSQVKSQDPLQTESLSEFPSKFKWFNKTTILKLPLKFSAKLIAMLMSINLLLPISWVTAAENVKKLPEPLYEGIPLACYVYNAKSSTPIEGNALDQALSLVEIAGQYNQSQQFDRAQQTLAVSLNYAKNSLASDRDKAFGLVQIAKTFANASAKQQATEVLANAEDLLPEIFGRDRIFSLITIAEGYLQAGDRDKAVEMLDQVVTSANGLEDKYARGRILAEAAQIYGQIPAFKARSQEILAQDLDLTKTFSNSAAAARIQLEIAASYAKQGEIMAANGAISTAIASLGQKSLGGQKSQGQKTIDQESNLVEAIAHDYLASAYLSVKNLDAALVEIDELPDSFNKAAQLSQIANLQLEAKKTKEAEKNNQRSLEIVNALEDPARATEGLSQIAVTYNKLGQTSKAVEVLKQAINLALRAEQTADKVTSFVAIAKTFDQIGQNNRAIQTLDQAYEIAIQTEQTSERAGLVASVTGAFGQIKDYSRALDIARGTADLPARSQLIRLYECALEVNQ
jgi:tetratricopeptide (TPR) repeat protein